MSHRFISQVRQISQSNLWIYALALLCLVRPENLIETSVVFGLAVSGDVLIRRIARSLRHNACTQAFVAPNVARQLRQHGVDALQTDNEISIVYADIRNFTSFSENTDSAQVMRFLREYYDAVGDVVEKFGGTIKDYAGDGILILIGAPQPVEDHAACALNMAVAIREVALEVAARWSKEGTELGIGVGIASGRVTAGIVGGAQRREYAAVGPAVNLSARLCGKAQASEILVADETLALAREQKCQVQATARGPLNLKGIKMPVGVASF